jgi:hypothetical protein
VKKIGFLIIAVIAAISVAGVVSAQETTPQPAPPTAGNEPIMRQLLQIVADDLSLQPQDILQQMRGQTLADIIKANNGDLTKITADITSAVTARVNQAVTDGQLTQDRANQILGNLDTIIQNALQGNGPLSAARGGFGGRGFGGPQNGQGGPRGPQTGGLRPDMLGIDIRPLLSAVEDATKLNPREIAEQIRGGKTLSEVITANGGDPAVVESAAIATATQKLDQIRTNGNLTQDQENAMVNGLKAFYDAVMNGNFRPQPQPQSTGSAPI